MYRIYMMETPTMLLVPIHAICRDMQLWWDKPLISSLRNCMPTETCFDDVGRICACVTWTQMYVTLQTKNVFHSKAVKILFFNQPLCIIFSVTHFNIEESLEGPLHILSIFAEDQPSRLSFVWGHAHYVKGCEVRWCPGLRSIPFFQLNSNSNSVIFNSNSNSTTHNKFQFQFQFHFRRFQFQFQFLRFQVLAISILEMPCWCLLWNWL